MRKSNMKIKHLLLSLILIFVYGVSFSQEYQLQASFEKDTIIIGEQTKLHLDIKIPNNLELIFPEYKDTLSEGVEVLLDTDHVLIEEDDFKVYKKDILITSFDTGLNVIPFVPVKIVEGVDTNFYASEELSFFVKPYVLLDTIPVDTIFSNRAGFVVYGRDGFKKEVEQYIPDSIKQSVSTDSLDVIKEGLKEQLFQLFSSELTQKTGLYDSEEILKIAESSAQKMFILDKGGIKEDFIVAGSVDTVFVQEYQQVQQGMPLFTLFRIKDINDDLYNTPFNLAEFWYYFKIYFKQYWWALLILLIVVIGLIYFLGFYKKGKKPTIFKIKNDQPAHIIALGKLENIRKEKLWSRGQVKEFHVQVTDTVREYIDNRYGIYAMEMTSSEVLSAFESALLLKDAEIMKLRQMLELADAVKFAKYEALQNENDLSIRNAIEFVESTKEIIVENTKDKKLEAEIEVEDSEENVDVPTNQNDTKDE